MIEKTKDAINFLNKKAEIIQTSQKEMNDLSVKSQKSDIEEPQNEENKEIDSELEHISKIKNTLDIESELKRLKIKYDISLKILRDRIKEKQKNYLKQPKEYKNLPCSVDKRFEQPELLNFILSEISKDHVGDDKEKIGTFLVGVSSKLPNPKDHVSAAHKGSSSAGKTNMQMAVVKHFPSEKTGVATRITASEMEDRIQEWDILVVTEINKNREGANTEITETFKQVMEDGILIFKKDNITGEPKEIKVCQKTGFYGTTEVETDDELETRFVVIPVRGNEFKNRAVVNDTLSKVSSPEYILNKIHEHESWIAESIRGLKSELDVVIPFANELNRKFNTIDGERELFDYGKERVKRDVKRLMSLTKAIAWLYQKRRLILDEKIIVAEPTDFITALKIFTPFFNISYSGLDPRIDDVLTGIKNRCGKDTEEIRKEFGDGFDKKDWVIRTRLQKEMGISVNTIKGYLKKLKDEGLVEVYWEESHPKFYLIQPVNLPISRLLDPITLQALIGHLRGDWWGKNIYFDNKKVTFDEIPLFEDIIPSLNDDRERASPSKLTGIKLTGINSEDDTPLSYTKNATILTLITNDTIDTIVTNDNEKIDNNCKNCNNYSKNPYLKDQKNIEKLNFEDAFT